MAVAAQMDFRGGTLDLYDQTQIGPITQEVGVPGPPDVQYF